MLPSCFTTPVFKMTPSEVDVQVPARQHGKSVGTGGWEGLPTRKIGISPQQPSTQEEVMMKAARKTAQAKGVLAIFLTLATVTSLSELSFGSVTRNNNGTYTARVSVTCKGGTASKSATGLTPNVTIPPPNNVGCNAGTSARAQRVVGTGQIIENATGVRGDSASAGSSSLGVIGVLPYATANFTMLETDTTSTQADFLITWSGDPGTAGQVQWTDFLTSNSLDVVNFAGGTSQTLTVAITDPNGISNIGFVAEVDAASIAPPAPEPSGFMLLGSGVMGAGVMLRRRLCIRS
jgi:hypothetical protein